MTKPVKLVVGIAAFAAVLLFAFALVKCEIGAVKSLQKLNDEAVSNTGRPLFGR